MTNTSSYSKGDLLEAKSYELLKTLLENDDFYVSGKKSKIFRKKGYYSEKRKSEIIFDISIETYLNNTSNYSLLTLIECKNYKSQVPINDIEEFESKISQISEHNTKGIIITNNSFQSGAYNFAKSSGIGLVKVNNNDEFEWLVNRKNNSTPVIKISDAIDFLENNSKSELNFIAANQNFVLSTLSELLIQIQVIDFFKHKEKFINIPFVTKDRIEQIISRLRNHHIYTEYSIDENKICDLLKSKYGVLFDFENQLPDNILGRIEFNPLKIQVSYHIKQDLYRWRFTLAHEIGNLILHSKILSEKIDNKSDTDITLSFKYNVSEMTTKRLEYQANLFASSLLLPSETLIPVVAKYFAKKRIFKGHLFWDQQPVNQELVFELLSEVSSLYKVSIEVVRIRLITLGLLHDNRYKSLKTLLSEIGLS